ncbi:hypothetical protein KKB28_10040, partial [bacterium]|nr:hypothetical protein [bacterium]
QTCKFRGFVLSYLGLNYSGPSMPLKEKPRRSSSTTRRVRQVVDKAPSLRQGPSPSIEKEIGRLPHRPHSEAQRYWDKIELESRVVWNRLLKAGGVMPFDDHSSAAEIWAEFGLSKKAFKRGLGKLFKQRRVELLPRGVRALTPGIIRKERKKKPYGKSTSRRSENKSG